MAPRLRPRKQTLQIYEPPIIAKANVGRGKTGRALLAWRTAPEWWLIGLNPSTALRTNLQGNTLLAPAPRRDHGRCRTSILIGRSLMKYLFAALLVAGLSVATAPSKAADARYVT